MNDTQEDSGYIDHLTHQWQLVQTDNTAQYASSSGHVLFICHCGAYKDVDIWMAPTERYQLTAEEGKKTPPWVITRDEVKHMRTDDDKDWRP